MPRCMLRSFPALRGRGGTIVGGLLVGVASTALLALCCRRPLPTPVPRGGRVHAVSASRRPGRGRGPCTTCLVERLHSLHCLARPHVRLVLPRDELIHALAVPPPGALEVRRQQVRHFIDPWFP